MARGSQRAIWQLLGVKNARVFSADSRSESDESKFREGNPGRTMTPREMPFPVPRPSWRAETDPRELYKYDADPSAIELASVTRRDAFPASWRVLVPEPRSILGRLELAVPTVSHSTFGPPPVFASVLQPLLPRSTGTRYSSEPEWVSCPVVSLSQLGGISGKIIPWQLWTLDNGLALQWPHRDTAPCVPSSE